MRGLGIDTTNIEENNFEFNYKLLLKFVQITWRLESNVRNKTDVCPSLTPIYKRVLIKNVN